MNVLLSIYLLVNIWGITSGSNEVIDDSGKKKRLDLLLEAAGCRCGGDLLANSACIKTDYQSDVAPNKAAVVNHTITYQKVIEVNEAKKSIKLNIKMEQLWEDSRIKTNFTSLDKQHGSITLSYDKVYATVVTHLAIWTPWYHGFHICDMLSMKSHQADPEEWFTSIELLYRNTFNQSVTLVKMSTEFEVAIPCNFDYDGYPLDTNNCRFRLCSGRYKLLLHDPSNKYNQSEKKYQAFGFDITTTFVNATLTSTDNLDSQIGFDISMKRILAAFLFQYYIPCIAIVLVSQTTFMVPLSAIPGRIALGVTQFLALTNLYIHQQVICGSRLY